MELKRLKIGARYAIHELGRKAYFEDPQTAVTGVLKRLEVDAGEDAWGEKRKKTVAVFSVARSFYNAGDASLFELKVGGPKVICCAGEHKINIQDFNLRMENNRELQRYAEQAISSLDIEGTDYSVVSYGTDSGVRRNNKVEASIPAGQSSKIAERLFNLDIGPDVRMVMTLEFQICD